MMFFHSKPTQMPSPVEALKGRTSEMPVAERHYVNDWPLKGPYPASAEVVYLGLGCFWGAERLFWGLPGVVVTAVGYQGGHTPNPTYEEVCSGMTAHAEMVKVVYDPKQVSLGRLLKTFFEEHDPTQGMRQGNDIGTQYRSAIYTTTLQQGAAAEQARQLYQQAYTASRLGKLTTEIAPAKPFFYAETEHQQYLAKHPMGYCGLAGTGVTCPLPTGVGLN